MKFSVFTLGCKVNRYESQAMMRKLSENGFEVTDCLERADAYIINTCSVTSEADKKSRQAVARALKYNSDAPVYIMGCSGQRDVMQYADKPNVKLITGTASKVAMLDNIMAGISPLNYPPALIAPFPARYEEEPIPFPSKTRGLIKVQDGCDNFCSYCIIPYLRGRSRSRALSDIVAEAERQAEYTEELIITGINISAYGRDTGSSLVDLVKGLGGVKPRKRFGSLECEVIDENLLLAMKDCGFCEHFHLSMQSGSDAVLKAMNRRYSSAYFLEKIDLIRKIFPDAGITTDIICGFPTETEENHAQTLKTAERAAFSGAHIFVYSKRSGTPAAKLPQVDSSAARRRAKEITDLTDKTREAFLAARAGKIYPVYLEEEENGFLTGYTPNYIKAYSSAGEIRKIKNLRIGEIYKDGVKVYE